MPQDKPATQVLAGKLRMRFQEAVAEGAVKWTVAIKENQYSRPGNGDP